MILSKTNIFNIFCGSLEKSSVLKIVVANCLKETVSYILNKKLSLNRLFINLSNKKDKACLTIDCQQNILNGPTKFREQKKIKERTYNNFISKRIPHSDEILFQIESVLRKTKKRKRRNF